MTLIFAAMSHKGGTGRSVTTANVGFQMALRGRDVCVVDLDLTSPTYGAILGLPGIAAGAPKGVHDLLPDHSDAPGADSSEAPGYLVNIWDTSDKRVSRARRNASDAGRFDLLPGRRPGRTTTTKASLLTPAFESMLVALQRDQQYAAIFLDVRSGTSEVARALLATDVVDLYLVFHRWTRQHIAGALKQIEGPVRRGRKVATIRTADLQGRYAGNEAWFHERDGDLRDAWRDGLDEVRRHTEGSAEIRHLRTIPLEPSLQVQERLITDEDIDKQIADPAIVSAYRSLAKELESG